MKNHHSFLFILFLILFSQKLIAQNSETDSTTSHLLIEKGIALHDDGKYDEAIKIYSNISKCDPNYWWACYETALSNYDLNNLELALNKCRESENLNPDNVGTLSLIGSILDDMGKTGEAIVFLNSALVTRPYNQNLLYNLAGCYVNDNQLEKAEELLIRSIRVNPYHRSSHLLLAKVNFYMGRVAQSYLVYNMAILLYPQVSYITQFEKAITGKLDSLSHPYNYSYPAGTDHRKWDELTWLMKSEMAFNTEFDFDYKINYLTTRQSLMLFRNLTFIPSDTSIYNQFYARFFTELMGKNYFEHYLNYTYKHSDNKSVAQWLKDNETKLNEFVNWAQKNFNSWRSYGFSISNEDKKIKTWHFSENGDLNAIGTMKTEPDEVKYGKWITVNEKGWIEQRGSYVNGKLEGEWQLYWPNGQVKQNLIFHEGDLDGMVQTYYPNGAKSGIYPMVKDKKEGLHEDFTPSGSVSSKTAYHEDKMDGKSIDYYYSSGYTTESSYKSGKIDGKISKKWLSGAMKSEEIARDSLKEGPYHTWYSNSKPESEGNYTAGVETGKWFNYFTNGSKEIEGEFDEKGELTGKKIAYYRNGNIESERSAYSNGVLTGSAVSYFTNGAIKSKTVYKEDKPVSFESFDASGKSLFKAELVNGLLKTKTYYPDGTIEMEGNMAGSTRDGKWAIYDPIGRISQELMYNNGFQSGKQVKYHVNGAIKEEYTCDSNNIIGLYKTYHSSGKLQTSGWLNKNGRTGEWVSYFVNDSVQHKSFYIDDEPVGRELFFSPKGGLFTEERFNGDGKSIRTIHYDPSGKVAYDWKYEYDSVLFSGYYPSGKLKIKQLIVNNKPQGISESYYPNGKLLYQNPYLYGNLNGISKSWDSDGNLEFEIPYVMGSVNGLMKKYTEGKPGFTYEYEYDQPQGYYTEYYSNGKPVSKIMYVDDQKHGNADYYAPDTSFMYRLIYYEDVLRAYTYKNAAGEFLPEIPVTPQTAEILSYYRNGNISSRTAMKNGCYDGESKTYYPNGKVMREKSFSKGDFEGIYKYYSENGKLKELINYHNDERNGRYELYFDNGQLKKTGQYIAGQAQGEWFIYNETGKLVTTLYYENDEIYDAK